MALELRPSREDDLERLLDIHATAFPDPRGREARMRNFRHNPLGDLGDLHVAIDGGTVVGHAFLFSLGAWFGGACVRVGGVATVGVAPEARGRGVGSALVEHLHEIARDRGDAITALYAFRQAFYARLGYAATSPYQRLRVDPRSIPDWMCPGARVRAARGDDRETMASLRDEVASRRTGMLARSRRHWDALLADERTVWMVVEHDGSVEGYVSFSLDQDESHAKTTLRVHEVVARADDVERHLWRAVAAQRGQVAEVHAELPLDHPLAHALVDADRARFGDARIEHALGDIAAGPMVRLVDVGRALEARGWAADGTLRIDVDDRALLVTVRGGRATVADASGEPCDLSVRDARALAAMSFGGLAPSQAERLGVATVRAEARATADALFAVPPYFSPDTY
jgi:predicted acetyltransferase